MSLWERDVRIHFIKIICVVRGLRERLECLVVGLMILAISNIVLSVCERGLFFFKKIFFWLEKKILKKVWKKRLIRWNLGIPKNFSQFYLCIRLQRLLFSLWCKLNPSLFFFFFFFFKIHFLYPFLSPSLISNPLITPSTSSLYEKGGKEKKIQFWGIQKGRRGNKTHEWSLIKNKNGGGGVFFFMHVCVVVDIFFFFLGNKIGWIPVYSRRFRCNLKTAFPFLECIDSRIYRAGRGPEKGVEGEAGSGRKV